MPTNLVYLEHLCPFRCSYCFSKPWHYEKIFELKIEKVKEKLKDLVDKNEIPKGSTIIFHGGEPGIIPIKIWEEFIEYAKSLGLKVSIQTNVWALSEELLEIIEREKMHIGISLDGPPELTLLRGIKHNLDWWDKAYEEIMEKIEKLHKKGLTPGYITILHKYNVGNEKRRKLLIEWAKVIGEVYNMTSGKYNPMFSYYPAQRKLLPTNEQVFEFFKLQFDEWTKLNEEGKKYNWEPSIAVISALLGLSVSPCWMQDCPPYETVVLAINSDGTGPYICDRTHHIGFFQRLKNGGKIRYDILRKTDCANCKYWEICHAGCPMEAYSIGYWMGKTHYCEAFKKFFEYVERKIKSIIPCITLSVDVPNWYEEYYKKGRKFNPLQWCGSQVTHKRAPERKNIRVPVRGVHLDGNIRHEDWGNSARNKEHQDSGMRHEDWPNHLDS